MMGMLHPNSSKWTILVFQRTKFLRCLSSNIQWALKIHLTNNLFKVEVLIITYSLIHRAIILPKIWMFISQTLINSILSNKSNSNNICHRTIMHFKWTKLNSLNLEKISRIWVANSSYSISKKKRMLNRIWWHSHHNNPKLNLQRSLHQRVGQ
jgi:hypothetical protein